MSVTMLNEGREVSAGAPPSRRTGYDSPFVANRGHWNKVFTDQDYFDSIAKQKGVAEAAKVSPFGDDYAYRQAMIGYMADTRKVPLEDMRAIYDAEKDSFAKKMLGKQTITSRELFDYQKQRFERENEKEQAARKIMDGVIQRSLQDALSGGDTPFVESVAKDIDAASEYFDDEEKSRLWEKAEELDIKVRAAQSKFAPEASFIFNALSQQANSDQGFESPDMQELAGRFSQLPDNQRRAIYELAGSFAQLNQTNKGFWYQMAESLGRGTATFTEAVPRNFKEQSLRGDLRLLTSDQPVFKAGESYSAAGTTPITPEEREQAKADIQKKLGVFKVERELRDLAERVIDPIKTVTFLPTIVEEGLYGAAQSIPYTAAAAVPYAGIPAVTSALFSSNYDRIMLEYPDVDPDKAALLAAISAPIEAGLERMKVNTITGRLPIVGGLVKRLQHPNQRNLTRILIGGAGVLAEQNAQEILQNATFPLVQTIGAALDQDIPQYKLDLASIPRDLAVQFVALLPLSLMGIGALSYREIKRGENYLTNKDNLEKAGFSQEQIDAITGSATPDEAQDKLREEYAKRDPKLVKAAAQRIVDESIALRERANPAALPRLEKQGADYVVLSPEGKELARSTDQTAAEQALVSARRETVQREMRDVHTGINEAMQFIQGVSEARQRGEDVATFIRDNSPRTLLTDYEANPTQQNLDQLFETVRFFGQEINDPAELANFPVTGSNQGELREGIWRSIIRINEGADATIVMREFAQDNLKRALAENRVTMDWVRQQLNEVLPQIDSDRIKRRLRTETDTDVIEAFSDVAVAYFRGSIREEQIPAGLRGVFRRLAIIARDIFRRAYNLARLRAEGKLDRDFEALLAEAVGVNQQALVDRARERTEQEVGAPTMSNYSIALLEDMRGADTAVSPETPVATSINGNSKEEIFESVKRRFGVTSSIYEAGYVLPDGTMLDFSGRSQASGFVQGKDLVFAPSKKQGDWLKDQRSIDHREIEWDGMPRYKETWASMVDFLRLGAIRIDANSGTISMHSRARPTSAQVRVLKDVVVSANGAYVDLEDDAGNSTAMTLESAKWTRVHGLLERWASGETPAITQNYSIGKLGDNDPYLPLRTADGKYKGAPKWINSPKTRRGRDEAYMRLRERLYQLVQEGAAGRFWYEDSGRAVLRMFNNNVVEAEKFIELLAIYSPQATVEVNTYFALRAYIQRAVNAAKEDFAVKTGAQDEKAKSVLYDNQPWAGRKTDNFYKNIMYVLLKELPPAEVAKLKLDAEVYEMLQKPVTVDMWVYRAFGFDSDALTDVAGTGAFGFAERELNRIAAELNAALPEGEPPYLPHQIQAMLWTAIKGRAETKEVKDLTEAQSMKAKDMVKVKNAQGKLVREFKDKDAQKRHMQRWITNALALLSEKLDVSMAAGAFDRFINSVSMRALWESVPSTNTPEGAVIANLPTAQKAAFTRASREIIFDENGNDMLAAMLGVPINVSKLFSGGYGTGVTPNVITELFPNKPSGTYDDDVVRAYARAIQYIFRQDAVPWMRYIKYGAENEKSYYAESSKGSKRRFATQAEAQAYADGKEGYVVKGDLENFAVKLDFGEQLTSDFLDQLQQGLVKVHDSLGFTQVSPTEVIVANFRDAETGLPALTDEQFSERIQAEYGQQADIAELYTVGEYGPVHDWSADPEGGSLLQASSRFTPDLLEWLRGRRAISDALQKDWAEGRGVVSNYSISTQSEIDRVSAAMDRLARSPSERIAQYAALKERLAAALERNQPIMQSMRGDTLPQDFDRTRLLNDLGFLDYILKVLPPEVRGRVGGYTNLAGIAPVDVYKGQEKVSEAKNPAGAIISAWMREGLNIGQAQKKTELPEGYSTVANTTDERRDKAIANFLIDRLKKIDRELERYYKRDLMERIFSVLDKSRPKAGESGVKRSTLGAETQKFADTVYRASLLDDEQTAERLAAIEAAITSTESSQDSQKRISELSEEWTIVNTFGDLKNRPSETMAYGLEWLQGQLKAGREAWNIKETARIEENRQRVADALVILGKPTDKGRFENPTALKRFLQNINALDLDHKSFEQFATIIFGDKLGGYFSEKLRQADISAAKAELENTKKILNALREGAKAAGMSTGKALVKYKREESNVIRKLEGRKVKNTEIAIDLAKKIVRGLADRGSLSKADVETLADELASLPRDTKKQYVTIKQVVYRGDETRISMNRATAMQLWLSWQQSDIQEKMRREGWNDDSAEDLENLLSDPVSQAILKVTRSIYGGGYALTNPVYSRMFGMNMPMVKNYAPARFLNAKEVKDVSLDGSPQTAGGQPSFAKSRVTHSAKIANKDGLEVLQQHIAQQAHWVAFAELTREYRSLLSNPEVRDAITQRYGDGVLATADSWAEQMEQRGGNKGREIAWINNMLGAAIGGQSVSLLGFNLKSLMMQTDNLMRSPLALDSRQIASAMSDPAGLMRAIRKVWETDILQTRLEGGATAETRFLFSRFVSMFRRGAKISELAMMPMNYVDSAGLSISGAIVYQAAYKDAIDSGMTEPMADQAAKDAVEAMIYRYGQPVLMGQKSNIENSGNVFAKTFFLFMSDPRLKTALLADSVRGLATGQGNWKDHVRRIVAVEMMAIVSHVLATAFRDATSDDDDEDLWSMGGFARALLLAPLQGYFLVGSVSEVVLSRLTEARWFTPTQNPLIRTADTAFKAFNNLDDAFNFDDPDALVKEWTNITRSIALTPPLAAPAVALNLVRPLVQAWERMGDE
jgi:hypothetical protein